MPTILIVEDESNIRLFIRTNLASRGYKVLEAESAEDGLALLHSQPVDGVILDILLPNMTGWDFVKLMAGDDGLRAVPVVILTASISDVDKDVKYPNVVARLVKPLSSETLVTTVRDMMG